MADSDAGRLAKAIYGCFTSPSVQDSNLEDANLVDVVNKLADGAFRVAAAINPPETVAGLDATGGKVDSLIEAVMGVTAGLVRIADAIESLADAVRGEE